MPTRATSRRALLLVPFASPVLLACGGPPTSGDMRDRAEKFIEDELEGDPDAGGITFEGTECEEPSSTETNTAFVCTSTGSDGQRYTFTVTIVGRNSLDLVSQPPLPGPTDTTAPTGSAPPGSAPAATTTTAAATTTTAAG